MAKPRRLPLRCSEAVAALNRHSKQPWMWGVSCALGMMTLLWLSLPPATPVGPTGPALSLAGTLEPATSGSAAGIPLARYDALGAHRHAKAAVFMQCSLDQCVQHAENLPLFWWQAVAEHGLVVVYVVSADVEGHVDAAAFPDFSAAGVHAAVAVLTVDAPEEHPPLRKEMALLRWARSNLPPGALVVKSDTDAVWEPGRLAAALGALDAASSSLFVGRPVAACECSVALPRGKKNPPCTAAAATHYCSGWLYATSVATLRSIPEASIAPVMNGTTGKVCKSSDLTVGRIMNAAGVRQCTPLTLPGTPPPPGGKSFPIDLATDKRFLAKHALCNNVGLHGGVGMAKYLAWPAQFNAQDFAGCVGIHPAKARHDVRYLAHHMLGGRSAPDWPTATGVCTVAVGLLSMPRDFSPRQAARLTYGPLASLLGVRLRFFVGHEAGGTPPVISAAIAAEGDVHVLDLEESYMGIWRKVRGMAQWAASTNCAAFVKTDVDTYIRPHQLLKELEALDLRADTQALIGNLWVAKPGTRNVVADPTSPWYMAHLYDKPTYPPYASGYLYILTMPLLRAALPHILASPDYPVEDAGMGICVEKVRNRVGAPPVRYEGPDALSLTKPCSSRTVAENAVTSHKQFNFYHLHALEMAGELCKYSTRDHLAASRSYAASVAFDEPGAVSLDASSQLLAHTALAASLAITPGATTRLLIATLPPSGHDAQWGVSPEMVAAFTQEASVQPSLVLRCLSCPGNSLLLAANAAASSTVHLLHLQPRSAAELTAPPTAFAALLDDMLLVLPAHSAAETHPVVRELLRGGRCVLTTTLPSEACDACDTPVILSPPGQCGALCMAGAATHIAQQRNAAGVIALDGAFIAAGKLDTAFAVAALAHLHTGAAAALQVQGSAGSAVFLGSDVGPNPSTGMDQALGQQLLGMEGVQSVFDVVLLSG